MELTHFSQKQLERNLKKIIGNYLDLKEYKIFFFGSRVSKNNFDNSDIDVGILGPRKIPAKIKLDIEENLDSLPTLYQIDLVDFKNVSATFKKHAEKNIKYIK